MLTWPDILARYLGNAVAELGCDVIGEPVYGWHDRTLGVRVRMPDDLVAWLRVASTTAEHSDAPDWTGNAEAAGQGFAAIPKPRVLRSLVWDEGHRLGRADLMTYVSAPVVAGGLVLDRVVDLPDAWWVALRSGLEPLARVRTGRVTVADDIAPRILALFGVHVDLSRLDWTTVHGDLHLANLTAPDLTILDWEHWGLAPAGYDAATLACSAILVPEVHARVLGVFADEFGTYTGAVAQLAAAATYLHHVELGDHPEIAVPIRDFAEAVARRHSRRVA